MSRSVTKLATPSRPAGKAPPRLLGYARASAGSRSVAAQIDAMEAVGCTKIYREAAPQAERLQLLSAIDALTPGDVLVVVDLRCLAKSIRDLAEQLAAIAAKGAQFRSLCDAWADTSKADGKALLAAVTGLADFHTDLIRRRTKASKAKSVAKGVLLGRKPKLTAEQEQEVVARHKAGETYRAIAADFAVSHSVVARVVNRHKRKPKRTKWA